MVLDVSYYGALLGDMVHATRLGIGSIEKKQAIMHLL